MDSAVREALCGKLLAMADDELILGHRNSEWTGHAPILEEDIAFSNIAQDEQGHAAVWYGLLGELTGDEADKLVFFRDAADFRNAQIVELPKGDWAFTMMRQYLFDAAEKVWLLHLLSSEYRPLAEAAAKIRTEELYHFRHSSSWVRRLGLGTEESHRRTQTALDTLWGYGLQLFAPLPGEERLVAAGFVPEAADACRAWEIAVTPFLVDSGLKVPKPAQPTAGSRTEHTPHLQSLIAELQEVARLDPEALW
jgi:ring-1,2-phenylacetyl-CoA epoxidase subunit PaaC